MDRILITGASGFLGSNIVKYLKKNYRIICGYNKFAPPENQVIRLDLSDITSIKSNLNKLKPDTIIHTAAVSRPSVCNQNPDKAEIINIKATQKIAEWSRDKQARLIFTSTDTVYSGKNPPYSEKDKLNAVNYYGKTKVTAEGIIKKLCSNYVILRLALMYGRGYYERKYSSEWLERDLKIKNNQKDYEPTGLYIDQYRSMISVKNVARVINELVRSNIQGVLNLGGPDSINRYDFGVKLCSVLGLSKKLIKPVKFKDTDPKIASPADVTLEVEKAKNLLSTNLLSISDGLALEYQL